MHLRITIRSATLDDFPAITAIYNEAVRTTTATFDTEPRSKEHQKEWFDGHTGRYPLLVAVSDGSVVGWASITRWSDRKAYDATGEISFYVRADFRGRGIGRRLTDAIIEEARKQEFHSLIARVAGESEVSLRMCRSAGFADIGVMTEVGRKFGRFLDVHLLQKML